MNKTEEKRIRAEHSEQRANVALMRLQHPDWSFDVIGHKLGIARQRAHQHWKKFQTIEETNDTASHNTAA